MAARDHKGWLARLAQQTRAIHSDELPLGQQVAKRCSCFGGVARSRLYSVETGCNILLCPVYAASMRTCIRCKCNSRSICCTGTRMHLLGFKSHGSISQQRESTLLDVTHCGLWTRGIVDNLPPPGESDCLPDSLSTSSALFNLVPYSFLRAA